jgi:hypothetical protein
MSSTCCGVSPPDDAWSVQKDADFSIFFRRRDESSVPKIVLFPSRPITFAMREVFAIDALAKAAHLRDRLHPLDYFPTNIHLRPMMFANGPKQTWRVASHVSEFDPKRTYRSRNHTRRNAFMVSHSGQIRFFTNPRRRNALPWAYRRGENGQPCPG